jgi:hypothetical protein
MDGIKFVESNMENIKILRYSVETNVLLGLSMVYFHGKAEHPKSLPYYFVSVDADKNGAHIQLNKFDGRYGSTSQCISRSTTALFTGKTDKEIANILFSGMPTPQGLYDAIHTKIKELCDLAMARNQVIIADSLPEDEANHYLSNNVMYGGEESGDIPAGYDTVWQHREEIKGIVHGYCSYPYDCTVLVIEAEDKMAWIGVPKKDAEDFKAILSRGSEIICSMNADSQFHIKSITANQTKQHRIKPA